LIKSDLDKYDTEGMYKIYDDWPNIAKKTYELDFNEISFENVNHIVFAGMGGSGSICDLFSSLLSKSSFHVDVIKGYHLPSSIRKDSLVIPVSISGNSIETLNILESAHKSQCKVLAFSSGGLMEKYCEKNSLKHQRIEKIHSPRTSYCSFIYGILKTINPIISINENEIKKSIQDLESLSKDIGSHNLSDSNPALNLANWISGIPLIYYPWGLQAAAVRFKNSLQENAKLHAIVEDVIESCHNGIVAWEKPSNIQPILLEGVDDYIRTKERWTILKNYMKENNIDFQEIVSIEGSILSKLICLVYLLDYCSIYSAVNRHVNPSPVKSIDYIKNNL